MLTVDHASVSVQDLPVVRDVSFAVHAGQAVGITGANGAGKTTLARAISGLARLTMGSVCLTGSDGPTRLDTLPPWAVARRGVVYVAEERNVFGEFSVRENLDSALLASQVDRARRAQLCARIGTYFPFLLTRLHQRASSLSGGERKILSIARAIMAIWARQDAQVSPSQVLVLDEPTHGLHPVMSDKVKALLDETRQTGVAVVIMEEKPAFLTGLTAVCWLIRNGSLDRRLW